MSSDPPGYEPAFRLDGGTTVTSTEESRAFFQARLSMFGFCLFVLAGGSWVLVSMGSLLSPVQARIDQHLVSSPASLLHLSNALLAGGLWLATRRGARRGRTLHALDIGISLGLIAVWGLSGAAMPNPTAGVFIAILSFTIGTLARAIVVPSTAMRTLAIGVLGGAIIVACSLLRARGPFSPTLAIGPACWCASATTVSWFASHTIFGLRREVQQARVFGQYTLDFQLGEGGMGSVWRASHALLRRPTAIKLLPADRMGEDAVRRFEREVQLTARLTHPNTVAIYDYGRTRDGIFYYAMELLDGTDLERLVLAHGPQHPGRVVHILTQICGALAEAHDLGLVHRDVKPANILLAPRKNEHEFAKIVDFGLAKVVDTGPTRESVTGANTITGTPLYMSPESIQSPDAVDARSDLYALGAVAWFLLVGRPVFEGRSIVAVCGQHMHSIPPRPSDALLRPLPSDLEDAILSCLQKDPGARPKDARVLRTRLEACQASGSWTSAHATEWWGAKSGLVAARAATRAAKTIALDFSTRGHGPLRVDQRR